MGCKFLFYFTVDAGSQTLGMLDMRKDILNDFSGDLTQPDIFDALVRNLDSRQPAASFQPISYLPRYIQSDSQNSVLGVLSSGSLFLCLCCPPLVWGILLSSPTSDTDFFNCTESSSGLGMEFSP